MVKDSDDEFPEILNMVKQDWDVRKDKSNGSLGRSHASHDDQGFTLTNASCFYIIESWESTMQAQDSAPWQRLLHASQPIFFISLIRVRIVAVHFSIHIKMANIYSLFSLTRKKRLIHAQVSQRNMQFSCPILIFDQNTRSCACCGGSPPSFNQSSRFRPSTAWRARSVIGVMSVHSLNYWWHCVSTVVYFLS